ncbi:sigma factor-like helix-turn-helix DNA-binding protein [Kribbella qitaiheensis]|uniref:sigma factor-like helix-turn-helix DNA-binding protein n=1 Tax=Kribbella qitaiheensis TaxID=1544730 RepID=UPI003D18F5BF
MFVLRDVFGLEYDEIAAAVGRNAAAVRQIAHRARAHVAVRRPRQVVSPAETRDALGAFQRAVVGYHRAARTRRTERLAGLRTPGSAPAPTAWHEAVAHVEVLMAEVRTDRYVARQLLAWLTTGCSADHHVPQTMIVDDQDPPSQQNLVEDAGEQHGQLVALGS